MKKNSSPQAARPLQKHRAKSDATPNRGRILLVEDDDATRQTLCNLLKARKFEVSDAGTVADAWALVAGAKFDLLISDIGLPDGDGYRLMHELRHLHGLKGIALTGYDMEEDFALSEEAGFSVHLTKPIKLELLDEALASLTGSVSGA